MVFAQAVATDPVLPLVNLGVIGIVGYLLITDVLQTRPAVKRTIQQYEDQIARLDRQLERLIIERNELASLIRDGISANGTQIQRLADVTEDVLHMVEALAIRQAK